MYENITFETIMERMLEKVPSNMDKREGSVIWDALAPAAIELQQFYIALDAFLDESFADTASLPYLVRRAAERGISQKLATKAVVRGEFTPDIVPIGSRFSCGELNYAVTDKIDTGVYKLTCETAGAAGNVNFGFLIPIDYIEGLETAELTDLLVPGEDDEDAESLRKRYFESMTSQAFGGNIADYKAKTTAIDGVGGVKVYPANYGGGTVKLTIIDDSFKIPAAEFVDTVQELIDPKTWSGKGYGIAPIGHMVTVVGVEGKTIDVVSTITYQTNWNWESAKSYILTAIDDYFSELSKTWADSESLIVRISQLESRILACEGVLDVQNTTLNGSESNIQLLADEIPVRGTVNG